MKKKIWIPLVCALAVICAFIGIFLYKTRWQKTEIYAETCPDDSSYRLAVYTVGEADFPYGATHLQVKVFKDGRTVNSYRFDMNNDGKAMSEENLYIHWLSDSVYVDVSAEESDTVFFTFGFDGSIDIAYID